MTDAKSRAIERVAQFCKRLGQRCAIRHQAARIAHHRGDYRAVMQRVFRLDRHEQLIEACAAGDVNTAADITATIWSTLDAPGD